MRKPPIETVSFVVLAKATSEAKSRLSPDRTRAGEIALGLATRTIETALRAQHGSSVIVVTSDPVIARTSAMMGAHLVDEGRPTGINAAAALGRRRALALRPRDAVVILVADLPYLTEHEIDSAVVEFRERGEPTFVADHTAVGTTCLMHSASIRPGIAFGRESARMHQRLGYVPAQRPLRGLRQDLDTPEDMQLFGVPEWATLL